jgi:DNA-directed RNA polymerase beta' subunit
VAYFIFFQGIKVNIFFGLQAEYHKELIDGFFKKHSSEYMSAKLIDVADNFDEFGARELAV